MIRLNVFIQVSESKPCCGVGSCKKSWWASSLKDKGCIAYDVFRKRYP